MNVTKTRTYDPGKRMFVLLAHLVDRPRLRSELYELGYEKSGADRAKALNRDITKLREFGYPITHDEGEDNDPLYSLDRDGLIGVDLSSADLTLLRLAAQSLTGKDELHKVARRTVQKLLGGAFVTDDQATVRITLPEMGYLFDIVEAMDRRAPIVIEYENPRTPERRFYIIEVTGVWETLGSFYCKGNRVAVGPTRGDMTECEPVERNFRFSRIKNVEALESTGYEAKPELKRAFDPVDTSIFLAPEAGNHLRDEKRERGTDGNGWTEYAFENANWPRLLDQLAVIGTGARSTNPDYRERLEHIAGLGES